MIETYTINTKKKHKVGQKKGNGKVVKVEKVGSFYKLTVEEEVTDAMLG